MDELDLWVDFSLSFTLVISQFIQGNFQRKNVRLIFLIILFKDILIILLLIFSRYFDYYIIILPFFGLTEVTERTIG